jgi:hypothetical protein
MKITSHDTLAKGVTVSHSSGVGRARTRDSPPLPGAAGPAQASKHKQASKARSKGGAWAVRAPALII